MGSLRNDVELLRHAIDRLKRNDFIEYTGEFGAEVTTFIPFVCWLKAEGLIEGRRVMTYGGMRPYYFFLSDNEYAEKDVARHWLPDEQRPWPSPSTHSATLQPWHRIPDYRARYAGEGRTFERPVLFIQNKFTVEFGMGPINYLPLTALRRLFALSEDRFHVVYSRPRQLSRADGYSADHNTDCDYPDLDLVRHFPKVEVLENLRSAEEGAYNRTKLEILAKTYLFVTVQGGGAHLLACFGSSMLLLLHLKGAEFPHAYASGPYRYLSSPPPVLLLARSHAELQRGINIIAAIRQTPKGFEIGAEARTAFKDLRWV